MITFCWIPTKIFKEPTVKKSIKTAVLLAIFCGVVLSPAFSLTIKMGSVAPEQSPWGTALNRLAAEWSRISNGRVQLKIYHNGIAGDESDMLRKLRIGQLQGVVLTSLGLIEIDPDFIAISMPSLIRDSRELSYVLDKLKPYFAAKLKEKNLAVLGWSKAGWVEFFGKRPILTPDDLKSMKLTIGGQDENFLKVWKLMGYNAVPVAISETLSALNSGMADALYASPLCGGRVSVVRSCQAYDESQYISLYRCGPSLG